MRCTKAIIPVAGFGTRRLPLTKAIEKCMIPVLNRPVVDYIVQDCLAAGIRDIYFVVGESCEQLKRYYGRNAALEEYLAKHAKDQLLELIKSPENATFHFIIQPFDGRYGTSVPVWLCRDVIEEGEKVLVIMGDQFMFNSDGASEAAHFLAAAEAADTPSAMLAVEVLPQDVSKYGIIEVESRGGHDYFKQIIEKPAPEVAPSNLNNASFYLFDKLFFSFLDAEMHRIRSDEHVITDPLNAYVQAGNAIAVIRNRGEYLDCGTVEGWLYANQRVAETSLQ